MMMTMHWPKDAVKVPYVGYISYYYRINGKTYQRSIDGYTDGDGDMVIEMETMTVSINVV